MRVGMLMGGVGNVGVLGVRVLVRVGDVGGWMVRCVGGDVDGWCWGCMVLWLCELGMGGDACLVHVRRGCVDEF